MHALAFGLALACLDPEPAVRAWQCQRCADEARYIRWCLYETAWCRMPVAARGTVPTHRLADVAGPWAEGNLRDRYPRRFLDDYIDAMEWLRDHYRRRCRPATGPPRP